MRRASPRRVAFVREGDELKLSTRRIAQLGLVAAFVVLAISVSALLVVPRVSKPVAVADVGTLAPDFELPDASGSRMKLSDNRGQVVVLFFAAPSDPQLDEFSQRVEYLARTQHSESRIKFFAVNVLRDELPAPLSIRFDERISARSYPTLLDNKAYVA